MWTCLPINEPVTEHAYQKMGLKKYKGIFRYGLKCWEVVCVRKGIFDVLLHRAMGWVKILPPPTLSDSIFLSGYIYS